MRSELTTICAGGLEKMKMKSFPLGDVTKKSIHYTRTQNHTCTDKHRSTYMNRHINTFSHTTQMRHSSGKKITVALLYV